MFVIFDLILRQIGQAQLENDRILLLKPDRFIKMNVILAATVTVPEKHPLHACERIRISLFQYVILFRHVDQGNQSCRSHFRRAGNDIFRKIPPTGTFAEYHRSIRFLVRLDQIKNVKLTVVSDGQRRGNARLQCRDIEIIGTGLRRDLKIGSLAVDTDILPGDFRNSGRKLNRGHAIVHLDIDAVNFSLHQPVFDILILQPDFFRRRFIRHHGNGGKK